MIQSFIPEANKNRKGRIRISIVNVKAKEMDMVSSIWSDLYPSNSPQTSPGKRKITILPEIIRRKASSFTGAEMNQ
jgi:hypothetical protein